MIHYLIFRVAGLPLKACTKELLGDGEEGATMRAFDHLTTVDKTGLLCPSCFQAVLALVSKGKRASRSTITTSGRTWKAGVCDD